MHSQSNYTPMTAHTIDPDIASAIRAGRNGEVIPVPDAATVAVASRATLALKADDGKVDLALVPPEAIFEIGRAFTFGAKKYAAHNWRKGFKWMRVTSALLRHVFAWMRGEDKDPESGLSHLAHAGACVCFLLAYEVTGAGEDDRYKTA